KAFNFRVALGKLITSLGKEFELRSLLFTEPIAHVVLYKKGGNNIVPLLVRPKTKEELAKEKAEEAKKAAEKKVEKKKEPTEPEKPFDFRELPTAIKVGKIGIEGGYFTVNIEAIGQTLKVSRTNVLLRDIHIDPKNLEKYNHVGLTTQFDLELQESKAQGIKSFKILFDLQGAIMPINPKTGQPTESVTLRMGLRKGSFVTGLAIFEKLKDKTEALNKIGIKLNFLSETQTLAKDAYATVYYNNGVITLKEPPALVTGDFEFRLSKEDYINVKSFDHLFRGDLALSAQHTKTVETELEKAIGTATQAVIKQTPAGPVRDQLANALAPEKIRAGVLGPAMKNGLLTLGIESSGNLRSPNVRVVTPQFPDLKSLIAAEAKKAANDLKGMVGAQLDALKQKAQAEAQAKVDEAKRKAQEEAEKQRRAAEAEAERQRRAAEEEAKRKAAEEAKKQLPKIPGF
ncbi:MAG: cell envelope integrity protein TolA, partial [Leptospiraceae bacterium]|nr:cell envelope integrity protein TolA [Leptospiraceae bacterium]